MFLRKNIGSSYKKKEGDSYCEEPGRLLNYVKRDIVVMRFQMRSVPSIFRFYRLKRRRRRTWTSTSSARSASPCCGGASGRASAEAVGRVRGRVERYGSRATVSFESSNIRIPLQFCQNSAKISQSFRNSENLRTSQHLLECSAEFREQIIKIGANFDENC